MVEDGIVPWAGSDELTPEQDYKAVYFNNTAAGTASVRIKGKGYYTGSRVFEFEILPKVKVMNEKNIALAEGKDYTVNYEDNNGPGTGKIILSGIGNYEGDVEATFDIVELPPTPTPTVKPTPAPTDLATDIKVGNVKRIKVLRKLSKATATWKKVEGAKSYQICYSASKKFTSKKQITVKKNKVLLKKLKSGKTYFLKVRAYKVNGKKKVYGKWSRKIIKRIRRNPTL